MDTDKHGGKNPLVEAAREIDIFAGARGNGEQSELDKLRGEKVADRLEDDPRFTVKTAADPEQGVEAANGDGSFEAMLRMFGGGMKPAMPGIEEAAMDGGQP